MNDKRTNPVLNRPNQGQSSREFLKDLEELMKRNKGGFGAMAFDVGSNRPYAVGGRVLQPNQETPSIDWRPGEVDQPEYVPEQQFPEFVDRRPPIQYETQPVPEMPTFPENPSPNEMLDAIFQETWSPSLPTTDQLEYLYQETGQTYPVQSNLDGTVTYNDGSIHAVDASKPPLPIASLADGTILWDDGFTRQMPPGGLSSYLAGVAGLSQFIFGEQQDVTQGFGNYNPELYASGYHQGVDYRTQDLVQRDMFAPVSMRVVQIISADSGSPYGNSVLLELPSGEMIRLSHLSTLGEYQEGQILNPGDYIGLPGSTGNSTGEHLDVEFYNQEGQLSDPSTFRANASTYSIANEITGTSPYGSRTEPSSMSTASTSSISTPTTDMITNMVQAPQRLLNTVSEATQPARESIAGTINDLNPTGTFDLGITESLQGQPEMAKQALASTIAQTGETMGLPETYMSEAAAEGGLTGALRQVAGNVIDYASTPLKQIGLPDFGISEAIAGGPTVNTDKNFIGVSANDNMSTEPTRQDYSGKLGESISNLGQEVGAKAGQGLEALKGVGSGIKNLIGKGLQTLTPRREVGEQSSQIAQQVGQTAQMSSAEPKNDIRDPFFKLGGAQLYSKYLGPDAENARGGALTMDLFSPDFFSNADNVANVFGGTYMGKEATDRFRESESSKLPMSSFTPMGYGEGEWSGEYKAQVDKYNQEGKNQTDQYNKSIEDYLSSIPSVLKGAFSFTDRAKPTSQRVSLGNVSKSNAAPNMSYAVNQPKMSFERSAPQQSMVRPDLMSIAPQMSFNRQAPTKPAMTMATPIMPTKPVAPKPKPSLKDYLKMGKTVAQWFAETGGQSVLDKLQKEKHYDPSSNKNPYDLSGQQMSVDPNQAVNTAITAASQGQQYVSPAGNVISNYTPVNANMSDASTGLPVVANNAPYPIQQMADGRIKYSDGSIR